MINIFNLLIKNKYKVFIIALIIFFLAFFGLWNVVSGGYDKQNKTILLLKKIIPTKLARKVRDTVFIIPDLKERNKFLELVMRKHDQELNGELFNEIILTSENNKKKYLLKEFFLPFRRLDLRLGWASVKNTLRKHYIESANDKILLISGEGQTIYFDKKNISNKKLEQKNLPNNINKILHENNFKAAGIRDLFVENNKVYITLYFKDSNGFSMNIYRSDLDFNKLNFELFFETKEYWKDHTVRTGGRIEKFQKNKILLSIGDGSLKNAAQNPNSILGKIISIDKTTKKYKIISTGHRNPQGLLFIEDLKAIINTEHGPEGGDEININFLNSDLVPNYGWDIASYGKEYGGEDPYKKSHSENGFIEPFRYYVPSIGISEITHLRDKLNDKDRYLFVSSLRAGSIYIIKTNKDINEILNEDRIFFQQRIRDIEFDDVNNVFYILFEEIPSIGILRLQKE